MITFLDLLIIVSMVLIAASFLSLVLMFLIRNKTVQHVCFYIAVGYCFLPVVRYNKGNEWSDISE